MFHSQTMVSSWCKIGVVGFHVQKVRSFGWKDLMWVRFWFVSNMVQQWFYVGSRCSFSGAWERPWVSHANIL